MCDTCGCGAHDHDSEHHHDDQELDEASRRTVEVQRNVLARNASYAADNRRRFEESGVLALNLISSPGAGKTSLLEATIRETSDSLPTVVIEGDLQTDRDAARIRKAGAVAHQINTGEGCHLDAHQVGHAVDHLSLPQGGVLFIENVGNLVCPAGFDLGEARRVVVLSVAEGDDKVEKYPLAFRNADLLVINKIDLLPYVDFSVEHAEATARVLNPELAVFTLSARTGEGLDTWCDWIRAQLRDER